MSKNGKGKNKDRSKKDGRAVREKLETAPFGEVRGSAAAADYGKELHRLQMEIAHLQAWVKKSKARVVIIFEGRDAAGKGGVIKRITERVSPRVFRVVALPAPTDREKSQIYMQRYIPHLPAAGEVVIFDRSWYNRPGVERVMGFCSEEMARRFLELAPRFEAAIVESGIILLKYFLDVSEDEQERRFRQRIGDPLRQWKLSPMDVESYQRWWDYSIAYDEMIRMTDTEYAPWWIVRSDDKKRSRINCISHILSVIPYDKVKFVEPELGKRQKRPDHYVESPHLRRYVPNAI
ncbi:polyphosphate kinase 2 [Ensifer adhaerens]|uniref:polyphosphate kinase 2 n=1 Tax=Ensifer adhaerens TaxID=106592 RepID=UPI000CF1C5B2|nr:polyphosphate kinase 2 [Ensifer adhaerens]